MIEVPKTLEILLFGRGFVIAADPATYTHRSEYGVVWIRVPRGTTIRTWGTENGIGELAAKGPLNSTQLDAIPHQIEIPALSIHMRILMDNPTAVKKMWDAMQEAEKRLLETH